MPGWNLTPAEAARAALQALLWEVRAERVPLVNAAYRYLAHDIHAAEPIPAMSRAAMDGFAVRAHDLVRASPAAPVTLQIAGEVIAGQLPPQTLAAGQALRVPTGGCLPAGADTVVPIEQAHVSSAQLVTLSAPAVAGRHVVGVSDDVHAGECVLQAGTWLGPRHLGVLAALGVVDVPVAARPRACVFSSGAEVVPVEATPSAAQVRDVNQPLIAAMASACGAMTTLGGIVPDEPAALTEHLQKAIALNEMVILSAGTSVGVRDFAAAVIGALPGARMIFHGVNMRPGKPTLAAVVERGAARTIVIGLPGFPVSAQVSFTMFAAPLLRRMQGAAGWPRWGAPIRARLNRPHTSVIGRQDILRVALQLPQEEAGRETMPTAVALSAGPALVKGLLQADGVVIVPAEVTDLAAGALVDVWLPLTSPA